MLAQKAIPKIYLIIGDSGAGKSSFINSLGGRDENDEMAETGHGGDAVTMTPGKIYKVDHEILGPLKLIDTRGTWDPNEPDNDKIFQDLIKSLIDLSVQLMEDQINNIVINGIIYVHSTLNYSRFPRKQRIAHLSTLLGIDLSKSTITLYSHYGMFSRWDQSYQQKFNELILNNNYDTNKKIVFPFVFWDSDSQYMQECQFINLNELIRSDQIQSFNLEHIQKGGDEILQLAEYLRDNDLEERLVIEKIPQDKIITRYIERQEEQLQNICIAIDRPNSYMIPISDNFYAQEHIYVGKITPKFPKDAILAYVKNCKVSNQTMKNSVLTAEPQLVEKGEHHEITLKYKWKAIDDTFSPGRLDIVIVSDINYKIRDEYTTQIIVEVEVKKLLPKSTSVKHYLKEAQEQTMQKIMNSIIQNMKNDQIRSKNENKNEFIDIKLE